MFPAVRRKSIVLEYIVASIGSDDVGIKLFQNDIAMTPGITPDDLVEADFGGYAAIAPAAGGTYSLSHDAATDEWQAVRTEAAVFTADNTIVGAQTIYGYWLSDVGGDPGGVWQIKRFPTPITVEVEGDAVIFLPAVGLRPDCGD